MSEEKAAIKLRSVKSMEKMRFSSDMIVRSIGNSLMVILPDLVGKKITYFFDLVRPLIAFKFQSVSLIDHFFIIYIIYKKVYKKVEGCNWCVLSFHVTNKINDFSLH